MCVRCCVCQDLPPTQLYPEFLTPEKLEKIRKELATPHKVPMEQSLAKFKANKKEAKAAARDTKKKLKKKSSKNKKKQKKHKQQEHPCCSNNLWACAGLQLPFRTMMSCQPTNLQ